MQMGKESFRIWGSLVFFAIVVSGCASSGGVKPPKWVESPPQDGKKLMYGVGSGHNIAYAKRSALQAIASQVSTTVKSTSQLNTSSVSGRVSRSFHQDIDTEVQELSFPGHKLTKTKDVGDKVFALVRVNRAGLAKRLVEDVRDGVQSLKREISRGQLSDLRVLAKLWENRDQIKQIRRKAYIARQLGGPDMGDAHKYLNGLADRKETLKSDLAITVVYSGNEEEKVVAQALSDRFLEFGLAAEAAPSAPSQRPTIMVETQQKRHEAFGSYNVKLEAVFNTVDSQGNTVSKVKKSLSGSSMTDYRMALKSAVRNMEKQIASKGVFPYLGV